jgi:predicted phage terminase large subunit-like protein
MNAPSNEIRRAIYHSDLHAFALKSFEVLNPGSAIDNNWHLEAISLALERVMARQETRLIINAPPRSLKSFFASVVLPAYGLGCDPARKYICASYSQDLASKLSLDCRRLMESDFYRDLFPNVNLEKSTETELQTQLGGFRYATSVGGTLTGRGADDLIIDDPLNASEAFSEANRKRVNEWFSRSLVSRLDRKLDGTITVIAQRLHPEDLSGHLLEQGGWGLLTLPAIAPVDVRFQLRRTAFDWKAGEPLQKIREPLSVLERLKVELGSAMFSAQYLQEPVPEGGNMLKPEWLREYDIQPVRRNGDRIVQSWDTAMKVSETSNYSACFTFLVRNSNEYYLLDVLRKKLEFPDLCSHVRDYARKFAADVVLIEDKASGTSLIQYTKKDGVQGVVGVQPEADKKTRMYSQTPKLEAKSLIIPQSAPWRSDFLKEYLIFPNGRYDDQIDALSQFLIWQSGRESSFFECDWGDNDHEGAPSPDEMFRRLARGGY